MLATICLIILIGVAVSSLYGLYLTIGPRK